MMAVLPSPESATEKPCCACPTAPAPTTLPPCCARAPPERVNTHTAPVSSLSPEPPKMAVFPSTDNATDCHEGPATPESSGALTSFPPCCVHRLPERVYAHAAPALPFSE